MKSTDHWKAQFVYTRPSLRYLFARSNAPQSEIIYFRCGGVTFHVLICMRESFLLLLPNTYNIEWRFSVLCCNKAYCTRWMVSRFFMLCQMRAINLRARRSLLLYGAHILNNCEFEFYLYGMCGIYTMKNFVTKLLNL